MKVITQISMLINALENCKKSENEKWMDLHESALHYIEKDYLPSGSGVDAGCEIDLERSRTNKIIINTSFHHMNENGYYTGWTDHKITIIPDLISDFSIKISGKDKNMIKDYLHDLFYNCLYQAIDKDILHEKVYKDNLD
jgi:hypothetical protein